MTDSRDADEARENWIAGELEDMQFPCAICGVAYGRHGLEELRQCFRAFTEVLREKDEEIERLKAHRLASQ